MKRLALPLAVAALAWAGFAPQASARPHRDGCGSSVSVCRYARCGCPVWRTRELPVEHRCDCELAHPREVEYREVYRVERRPLPPPPVVSGSLTIETSW